MATKERPIAYEPHPVTPERKKELIDKGYQILDAKFKPREAVGAPAVTRKALDKALADLPGGNTDPDYVVNAMRSHFGDLFTDHDEATVREVVMPAKPSDGLTVPELKDALAKKNVEIPEGAKKAELQALLDAAE